MKISVAMATYNGEKYIQKQLDSILNQSHKVNEIILVDDKSTDNTREVIQKYIQQHPEMKFSFYVNEENLGYKKNFKKAMSYCRGEYIFLCDQDDIWLSNKVEEMIAIMDTHPNILSLASSFSFIDKDDKTFEVEKVKGLSNNNLLRRNVEKDALVSISFDELCIQNYFQGCALVIRKKISEEFQKIFTEELFHDWLLNLIAAKYEGMFFINKPLFQYRIHDHNTIGINEEKNVSRVDRLRKTNLLYYRTYAAKQSIDTLSILLKTDSALLNYQPETIKKIEFYENHIRYLAGGRIIKLLLQNKSPYYKLIKTRKARIMDIYFCFKQWLSLK